MNSSLFAIFLTILLSLFAVVGDYFLKTASNLESPFRNWNFLAGFLIYSLSAFGWVLVMPHLKLAYLGVILSITMILSLCVLGIFFFDESLSPKEWVGVGLAIASLVLLQRVA
ncbi:MAG: transporter [Candidatus Omnitrophica bacterium]|nr:transporter [Candidatus Omnitrophota bacterium]MCB1229794.1 transporter [Verrucomicrobiae bacterium]